MPDITDIKKDKDNLIITYDDGISGELDILKLSRKPGYEKLTDPGFAASCVVDKPSGDIIWNDCPPLCKNALYKQFELKSLLNRLKISEDLL